MKAMILAAGLGTRLGPLTKDSPKALVKAGNMTLLERLITKLKVQGVKEIVINVHHHANKIIRYLADNDNFGVSISISNESDELLDTGGGIFGAAPLLGDEPFIVHNVDILSDIDLRKLMQQHTQSGAIATLAVKHRNTSRYLLFDENKQMRGWENRSSGERIIPGRDNGKLIPLAFSGIHAMSPEIFSLYPHQGPFSIIQAYLDICSSWPVMAYQHDTGLWIDAGKPDGLQLANALLGSL